MNDFSPAKSFLRKLNPVDNVYVSFQDLAPFKRGFKYASDFLPRGSRIVKLGNAIGYLTDDVEEFGLVHTHNVAPAEDVANDSTKSYCLNLNVDCTVSLFCNPFSGRNATRKNILIISTVSCVNRVVLEVARDFESSLDPFTTVIPITHNSGCGMVVGSIDHVNLQKTLKGFLLNPNTFDAVVIGLGCEDNQFKALVGGTNACYLDIQDYGEPLVKKKAKDYVASAVNRISKLESSACSLGDITFALQCGGSDSFSAITANPLLGYCSTSLLRNGASIILSETPEVRGFEKVLSSLCKTDQDRSKLLRIFADWDTRSIGTSNPAPGNFAGGISTNLEKSIGAIQKFGFNRIDQVLDFAEIPHIPKGMFFMDSPGYDPCSVTGQIACGATCLIFTTGRGSNYVNSYLPTIKIGSTTRIANKHYDFIDIDAEKLLATKSLEDAVLTALDKISSSVNKPNDQRMIHSDFVPWIQGGMN